MRKEIQSFVIASFQISLLFDAEGTKTHEETLYPAERKLLIVQDNYIGLNYIEYIFSVSHFIIGK